MKMYCLRGHTSATIGLSKHKHYPHDGGNLTLKSESRKGMGHMPDLTKLKRQKGFTLLEVLLVVAVIAILAGIVIIAINPGKNLADTRDSQRKADVNTIINAVYQYALDNSGALPTIPTSATPICTTTGAPCTSPAAVDLGVLTADGKYLVALPKDPKCSPTCTQANSTGYTILKDATSSRITVAAPDKEGTNPISVSR
jgi:prepilin-type N-terminal cleavage/methylation domain-containing protein